MMEVSAGHLSCVAISIVFIVLFCACAVLCVYVSVQRPYVGRLVHMSKSLKSLLNQLGEVRHDAPSYKKHCDIIH